MTVNSFSKPLPLDPDIPQDALLSAGFRRNKLNPLPCCLLGRLAVDKRYQGQGLGGALLVEALKITQGVSRMSGCWALVVQPKGEKEIGFYEHLGFRRCKVGDPPMLFFEIEQLH